MSEDFDKSEQKKTEYVLVDIDDVSLEKQGHLMKERPGQKLLQGLIQDEINKRPNMRLVNIIPLSLPKSYPGKHTILQLLFEEREQNLDSIREDIAKMKEQIDDFVTNLVKIAEFEQADYKSCEKMRAEARAAQSFAAA